MALDGALSAAERQEYILRFIGQHSRATVAGISKHFSISLATSRRDLDALAERGEIQRIHGGALALRPSTPDLPVVQRAGEQAEEKRRIGAAAAALVGDGDTVFLGSGTT